PLPVPPSFPTRRSSDLGDVKPRHRAKEFLSFLRKIDRAVKAHLAVHLVLDNYAAHKTPEVKAWLAKHPRFHCHFTPTSASWLNLDRKSTRLNSSHVKIS